ncbi:hypothetical protein GMRT_10929 [Giardia muris]|uniref:Uncharacterized protein n=1 Tax=Giardia muris TaxID=5742 RepID=A0A4Z1SY71_GIAMU|nr:hypothetical protein GMRT_10929 [Giardia muris]|eukprot:TNJ30450.1 hypothetical protein GMRT_10929 [Giardia muris]
MTTLNIPRSLKQFQTDKGASLRTFSPTRARSTASYLDSMARLTKVDRARASVPHILPSIDSLVEARKHEDKSAAVMERLGEVMQLSPVRATDRKEVTATFLLEQIISSHAEICKGKGYAKPGFGSAPEAWHEVEILGVSDDAFRVLFPQFDLLKQAKISSIIVKELQVRNFPYDLQSQLENMSEPSEPPRPSYMREEMEELLRLSLSLSEPSIFQQRSRRTRGSTSKQATHTAIPLDLDSFHLPVSLNLSISEETSETIDLAGTNTGFPFNDPPILKPLLLQKEDSRPTSPAKKPRFSDQPECSDLSIASLYPDRRNLKVLDFDKFFGGPTLPNEKYELSSGASFSRLGNEESAVFASTLATNALQNFRGTAASEDSSAFIQESFDVRSTIEILKNKPSTGSVVRNKEPSTRRSSTPVYQNVVKEPDLVYVDKNGQLVTAPVTSKFVHAFSSIQFYQRVKQDFDKAIERLAELAYELQTQNRPYLDFLSVAFIGKTLFYTSHLQLDREFSFDCVSEIRERVLRQKNKDREKQLYAKMLNEIVQKNAEKGSYKPPQKGAIESKKDDAEHEKYILELLRLERRREEQYNEFEKLMLTHNQARSAATELCLSAIEKSRPAMMEICKNAPRGFDAQGYLALLHRDYVMHATTTDFKIAIIAQAERDPKHELHWCSRQLFSFLNDTGAKFRQYTVPEYDEQRRKRFLQARTELEAKRTLFCDEEYSPMYRKILGILHDHLRYLVFTPQLLAKDTSFFVPRISEHLFSNMVFQADLSELQTPVRVDPQQATLSFSGIHHETTPLHFNTDYKPRNAYEWMRLKYWELQNDIEKRVCERREQSTHQTEVTLAALVAKRVEGNVQSADLSALLFKTPDPSDGNFLRKLSLHLTNCFVLLYEVIFPYIQEIVIIAFSDIVFQRTHTLIRKYCAVTGEAEASLDPNLVFSFQTQAHDENKERFHFLLKRIEVMVFSAVYRHINEIVFPQWTVFILLLFHGIDRDMSTYNYSGALVNYANILRVSRFDARQIAELKKDYQASECSTSVEPSDVASVACFSFFQTGFFLAIKLPAKPPAFMRQLDELVEVNEELAAVALKVIAGELASPTKKDSDDVPRINRKRPLRLFESPEVLALSLARVRIVADLHDFLRAQPTDLYFVRAIVDGILRLNKEQDVSFRMTEENVRSILSLLNCAECALEGVYDNRGRLTNVLFIPDSNEIFINLPMFIFDLIDFFYSYPIFVDNLFREVTVDGSQVGTVPSIPTNVDMIGTLETDLVKFFSSDDTVIHLLDEAANPNPDLIIRSATDVMADIMEMIVSPPKTLCAKKRPVTRDISSRETTGSSLGGTLRRSVRTRQAELSYLILNDPKSGAIDITGSQDINTLANINFDLRTRVTSYSQYVSQFFDNHGRADTSAFKSRRCNRLHFDPPYMTYRLIGLTKSAALNLKRFLDLLTQFLSSYMHDILHTTDFLLDLGNILPAQIVSSNWQVESAINRLGTRISEYYSEHPTVTETHFPFQAEAQMISEVIRADAVYSALTNDYVAGSAPPQAILNEITSCADPKTLMSRTLLAMYNTYDGYWCLTIVPSTCQFGTFNIIIGEVLSHLRRLYETTFNLLCDRVDDYMFLAGRVARRCVDVLQAEFASATVHSVSDMGSSFTLYRAFVRSLSLWREYFDAMRSTEHYLCEMPAIPRVHRTYGHVLQYRVEASRSLFSNQTFLPKMGALLNRSHRTLIDALSQLDAWIVQVLDRIYPRIVEMLSLTDSDKQTCDTVPSAFQAKFSNSICKNIAFPAGIELTFDSSTEFSMLSMFSKIWSEIGLPFLSKRCYSDVRAYIQKNRTDCKTIQPFQLFERPSAFHAMHISTTFIELDDLIIRLLEFQRQINYFRREALGLTKGHYKDLTGEELFHELEKEGEFGYIDQVDIVSLGTEADMDALRDHSPLKTLNPEEPQYTGFLQRKIAYYRGFLCPGVQLPCTPKNLQILLSEVPYQDSTTESRLSSLQNIVGMCSRLILLDDDVRHQINDWWSLPISSVAVSDIKLFVLNAVHIATAFKDAFGTKLAITTIADGILKFINSQRQRLLLLFAVKAGMYNVQVGLMPDLTAYDTLQPYLDEPLDLDAYLGADTREPYIISSYVQEALKTLPRAVTDEMKTQRVLDMLAGHNINVNFALAVHSSKLRSDRIIQLQLHEISLSVLGVPNSFILDSFSLPAFFGPYSDSATCVEADFLSLDVVKRIDAGLAIVPPFTPYLSSRIKRPFGLHKLTSGATKALSHQRNKLPLHTWPATDALPILLDMKYGYIIGRKQDMAASLSESQGTLRISYEGINEYTTRSLDWLSVNIPSYLTVTTGTRSSSPVACLVNCNDSITEAIQAQLSRKLDTILSNVYSKTAVVSSQVEATSIIETLGFDKVFLAGMERPEQINYIAEKRIAAFLDAIPDRFYASSFYLDAYKHSPAASLVEVVRSIDTQPLYTADNAILLHPVDPWGVVRVRKLHQGTRMRLQPIRLPELNDLEPLFMGYLEPIVNPFLVRLDFFQAFIMRAIYEHKLWPEQLVEHMSHIANLGQFVHCQFKAYAELTKANLFVSISYDEVDLGLTNVGLPSITTEKGQAFVTDNALCLPFVKVLEITDPIAEKHRELVTSLRQLTVAHCNSTSMLLQMAARRNVRQNIWALCDEAMAFQRSLIRVSSTCCGTGLLGSSSSQKSFRDAMGTALAEVLIYETYHSPEVVSKSQEPVMRAPFMVFRFPQRIVDCLSVVLAAAGYEGYEFVGAKIVYPTGTQCYYLDGIIRRSIYARRWSCPAPLPYSATKTMTFPRAEYIYHLTLDPSVMAVAACDAIEYLPFATPMQFQYLHMVFTTLTPWVIMRLIEISQSTLITKCTSFLMQLTSFDYHNELAYFVRGFPLSITIQTIYNVIGTILEDLQQKNTGIYDYVGKLAELVIALRTAIKNQRKYPFLLFDSTYASIVVSRMVHRISRLHGVPGEFSHLSAALMDIEDCMVSLATDTNTHPSIYETYVSDGEDEESPLIEQNHLLGKNLEMICARMQRAQNLAKSRAEHNSFKEAEIPEKTATYARTDTDAAKREITFQLFFAPQVVAPLRDYDEYMKEAAIIQPYFSEHRARYIEATINALDSILQTILPQINVHTGYRFGDSAFSVEGLCSTRSENKNTSIWETLIPSVMFLPTVRNGVFVRSRDPTDCVDKYTHLLGVQLTTLRNTSRRKVDDFLSLFSSYPFLEKVQDYKLDLIYSGCHMGFAGSHVLDIDVQYLPEADQSLSRLLELIMNSSPCILVTPKASGYFSSSIKTYFYSTLPLTIGYRPVFILADPETFSLTSFLSLLQAQLVVVLYGFEILDFLKRASSQILSEFQTLLTLASVTPMPGRLVLWHASSYGTSHEGKSCLYTPTFISWLAAGNLTLESPILIHAVELFQKDSSPELVEFLCLCSEHEYIPHVPIELGIRLSREACFALVLLRCTSERARNTVRKIWKKVWNCEVPSNSTLISALHASSPLHILQPDALRTYRSQTGQKGKRDGGSNQDLTFCKKMHNRFISECTRLDVVCPEWLVEFYKTYYHTDCRMLLPFSSHGWMVVGLVVRSILSREGGVTHGIYVGRTEFDENVRILADKAEMNILLSSLVRLLTDIMRITNIHGMHEAFELGADHLASLDPCTTVCTINELLRGIPLMSAVQVISTPDDLTYSAMGTVLLQQHTIYIFDCSGWDEYVALGTLQKVSQAVRDETTRLMVITPSVRLFTTFVQIGTVSGSPFLTEKQEAPVEGLLHPAVLVWDVAATISYKIADYSDGLPYEIHAQDSSGISANQFSMILASLSFSSHERGIASMLCTFCQVIFLPILQIVIGSIGEPQTTESWASICTIAVYLMQLYNIIVISPNTMAQTGLFGQQSITVNSDFMMCLAIGLEHPAEGLAHLCALMFCCIMTAALMYTLLQRDSLADHTNGKAITAARCLEAIFQGMNTMILQGKGENVFEITLDAFLEEYSIIRFDYAKYIQTYLESLRQANYMEEPVYNSARYVFPLPRFTLLTEGPYEQLLKCKEIISQYSCSGKQTLDVLFKISIELQVLPYPEEVRVGSRGLRSSDEFDLHAYSSALVHMRGLDPRDLKGRALAYYVAAFVFLRKPCVLLASINTQHVRLAVRYAFPLIKEDYTYEVQPEILATSANMTANGQTPPSKRTYLRTIKLNVQTEESIHAFFTRNQLYFHVVVDNGTYLAYACIHTLLIIELCTSNADTPIALLQLLQNRTVSMTDIIGQPHMCHLINVSFLVIYSVPCIREATTLVRLFPSLVTDCFRAIDLESSTPQKQVLHHLLRLEIGDGYDDRFVKKLVEHLEANSSLIRFYVPFIRMCTFLYLRNLYIMTNKGKEGVSIDDIIRFVTYSFVEVGTCDYDNSTYRSLLQLLGTKVEVENTMIGRAIACKELPCYGSATFSIQIICLMAANAFLACSSNRIPFHYATSSQREAERRAVSEQKYSRGNVRSRGDPHLVSDLNIMDILTEEHLGTSTELDSVVRQKVEFILPEQVYYTLCSSYVSGIRVPLAFVLPAGVNYPEFVFILSRLTRSEVKVPLSPKRVATDSLIIDIGAACGTYPSPDNFFNSSMQQYSLRDRVKVCLRAAISIVLRLSPSTFLPPSLIKRGTPDTYLIPGSNGNSESQEHNSLPISTSLPVILASNNDPLILPKLELISYTTATGTVVETENSSTDYNQVTVVIPLSLIFATGTFSEIYSLVEGTTSGTDVWYTVEMTDILSDFSLNNSANCTSFSFIMSILATKLSVIIFEDVSVADLSPTSRFEYLLLREYGLIYKLADFTYSFGDLPESTCLYLERFVPNPTIPDMTTSQSMSVFESYGGNTTLTRLTILPIDLLQMTTSNLSNASPMNLNMKARCCLLTRLWPTLFGPNYMMPPIFAQIAQGGEAQDPGRQRSTLAMTNVQAPEAASSKDIIAVVCGYFFNIILMGVAPLDKSTYPLSRLPSASAEGEASDNPVTITSKASPFSLFPKVAADYIQHRTWISFDSLVTIGTFITENIKMACETELERVMPWMKQLSILIATHEVAFNEAEWLVVQASNAEKAFREVQESIPDLTAWVTETRGIYESKTTLFHNSVLLLDTKIPSEHVSLSRKRTALLKEVQNLSDYLLKRALDVNVMLLTQFTGGTVEDGHPVLSLYLSTLNIETFTLETSFQASTETEKRFLRLAENISEYQRDVQLMIASADPTLHKYYESYCSALEAMLEAKRIYLLADYQFTNASTYIDAGVPVITRTQEQADLVAAHERLSENLVLLKALQVELSAVELANRRKKQLAAQIGSLIALCVVYGFKYLNFFNAVLNQEFGRGTGQECHFCLDTTPCPICDYCRCYCMCTRTVDATGRVQTRSAPPGKVYCPECVHKDQLISILTSTFSNIFMTQSSLQARATMTKDQQLEYLCVVILSLLPSSRPILISPYLGIAPIMETLHNSQKYYLINVDKRPDCLEILNGQIQEAMQQPNHIFLISLQVFNWEAFNLLAVFFQSLRSLAEYGNIELSMDYSNRRYKIATPLSKSVVYVMCDIQRPYDSAHAFPLSSFLLASHASLENIATYSLMRCVVAPPMTPDGLWQVSHSMARHRRYYMERLAGFFIPEYVTTFIQQRISEGDVRKQMDQMTQGVVSIILTKDNILKFMDKIGSMLAARNGLRESLEQEHRSFTRLVEKRDSLSAKSDSILSRAVQTLFSIVNYLGRLSMKFPALINLWLHIRKIVGEENKTYTAQEFEAFIVAFFIPLMHQCLPVGQFYLSVMHIIILTRVGMRGLSKEETTFLYTDSPLPDVLSPDLRVLANFWRDLSQTNVVTSEMAMHLAEICEPLLTLTPRDDNAFLVDYLSHKRSSKDVLLLFSDHPEADCADLATYLIEQQYRVHVVGTYIDQAEYVQYVGYGDVLRPLYQQFDRASTILPLEQSTQSTGGVVIMVLCPTVQNLISMSSKYHASSETIVYVLETRVFQYPKEYRALGEYLATVKAPRCYYCNKNFDDSKRQAYLALAARTRRYLMGQQILVQDFRTQTAANLMYAMAAIARVIIPLDQHALFPIVFTRFERLAYVQNMLDLVHTPCEQRQLLLMLSTEGESSSRIDLTTLYNVRSKDYLQLLDGSPIAKVYDYVYEPLGLLGEEKTKLYVMSYIAWLSFMYVRKEYATVVDRLIFQPKGSTDIERLKNFHSYVMENLKIYVTCQPMDWRLKENTPTP